MLSMGEMLQQFGEKVNFHTLGCENGRMIGNVL